MISKENNERLTQVGPGTPMGNLLRRYWHPVAATSELKEVTKKVRILGEDLVLYRDLSGNLGLIEEQCPHRRASMAYGIPEENGLRCPYHGWLFDNTGQCLEQPAEPAESTFKDRICMKSYPVQELGGLIFSYMGPLPAPLLPNFDLFVEENAVKQIGIAVIPCNYLQCMENSVDPTHTEWLHGVYMDYVMRTKNGQKLGQRGFLRHHVKIGFDVFDYGIIKRRLLEGQSEDSEDWTVGHPVVFPTMLKVGSQGRYSFQIRVPIDDTTTRHYWYIVLKPSADLDIEIPKQDYIPSYDFPFKDENGEYMVDYVDAQDIMCWVTQGAIADRSNEALGTSDKGVILFRQLIQENIKKVENGEDPLGTVRDPAKNVRIDLPQEEKKAHADGGSFKKWRIAYAPEVHEFMERYEAALLKNNVNSYGEKKE